MHTHVHAHAHAFKRRSWEIAPLCYGKKSSLTRTTLSHTPLHPVAQVEIAPHYYNEKSSLTHTRTCAQVEIAPHYYSKKEIMEQAAKKLPKALGKAAETG